MASELRQRRQEPGQEPGQEASSLELPKGSEALAEASHSRNPEAALKDAESMLEKIREGPRPGLSNEAKEWKDALREDPYNMIYIFQLGLAYAQDLQWDKCCNVMLRGMKRVNEFENEEVRVHFLMTLCQASLSLSKFRQALAVFNDIVEPIEEGLRKRYEALKCYVLCTNGDTSGGLKAFHNAIAGEDFDACLGIWALCYPGLQTAGALEVTRNALDAMATDEAMKKRLQLVELVRQLKESTAKEKDRAKQSKSMVVRVVAVAVIVFLGIAAYFLHHLEASNLEKLKIRK